MPVVGSQLTLSSTCQYCAPDSQVVKFYNMKPISYKPDLKRQKKKLQKKLRGRSQDVAFKVTKSEKKLMIGKYLGGAIALVVLVVSPAGLDDELEDGTTMGLPRLELKGWEVLETLEVGIL